MKSLQEIYGYEALFLTRRGLELGDEKWLKKNVVKLHAPPIEVYAKILALFRRVAKKAISIREVPARISIRALKRRVTIVVTGHPLLDKIRTGSIPPLSNGLSGWEALRHGFWGLVVPAGNNYRGPSGSYFPMMYRIPNFNLMYPVSHGVSSFKLTYLTKIIVLPTGYYTITADTYLADVSGAAKIFVGDTCFAKILEDTENFLNQLDTILAEVVSIFEEDIVEVAAVKEAEFYMVGAAPVFTGYDGILEAAKLVNII